MKDTRIPFRSTGSWKFLSSGHNSWKKLSAIFSLIFSPQVPSKGFLLNNRVAEEIPRKNKPMALRTLLSYFQTCSSNQQRPHSHYELSEMWDLPETKVSHFLFSRSEHNRGGCVGSGSGLVRQRSHITDFCFDKSEKCENYIFKWIATFTKHRMLIQILLHG